MLTLYCAIGPSGLAYSLDSLIRRRRIRIEPSLPSIGANVAIRLIQLHMCVIYFFAGIAKLQGETWWNGLAMWYSFANREYQTMNMTWLAEHPLAINAMTHLTVFRDRFLCAGLESADATDRAAAGRRAASRASACAWGCGHSVSSCWSAASRSSRRQCRPKPALVGRLASQTRSGPDNPFGRATEPTDTGCVVRFQQGDDLVDVGRFDQILVEARFACPADVGLIFAAGNCDEQRFAQRGALPHLPQHFAAVHVGQAEVHEHGGRLKVEILIDGRPSGLGRQRLPARTASTARPSPRTCPASRQRSRLSHRVRSSLVGGRKAVHSLTRRPGAVSDRRRVVVGCRSRAGLLP